MYSVNYKYEDVDWKEYSVKCMHMKKEGDLEQDEINCQNLKQ